MDPEFKQEELDKIILSNEEIEQLSKQIIPIYNFKI